MDMTDDDSQKIEFELKDGFYRYFGAMLEHKEEWAISVVAQALARAQFLRSENLAREKRYAEMPKAG
jgi:hypothetical protein